MLVRATPEDGCVILNADDLRVMEMKNIACAVCNLWIISFRRFSRRRVRQEYVGGDEAASDNTKIEMNGTIKSDSDSAPFKLKNIWAKRIFARFARPWPLPLNLELV